MAKNDPQPDQPIAPGNGNGDPQPRPPRITSISPIGGALAGGISATITGLNFQPGAEVFFGTVAALQVRVTSSRRVTLKVPPAAQAGTVPVSLVNPDGATAELTSGFTYVSSEQGDHAEVHGVEPINVIEDTDTQITIRGHNLIAAHESGLVALRGPGRAIISVSDFASSHDDASGIDSLTCTVRVTATPALAEKERMAIQVLASLRPAAQSDGVVESSREMFVVLPKTIPVPVAFTASLNPERPNLVVVTGRNLAGCSLDLGANATIHMQSSDDEVVAALVSYPADQAAPQLSIRSDAGGEVARFEMAVETAAASKNASLAVAGNGDDPGGDPGPTLTPAPGQQVTGPTAESSAVVNLNGQSLFSFNFDWSGFVVQFFHIRFRLRIANFMRVVPFFDGGGEEVDSPVVAKVGQLMNLRGMGILIALRVEITITISVSIILGFRHGFDFGPWNQFPEFGFGLGSVVIGFRFDIDIEIEIFFLTALILPDGSLKVLALIDFDINFHFEISTDLRTLRFNNFKHKVDLRRIGPFANNLSPCDGRFQLAEENGQTVFPDAFGGHQAFYFVRAPGRCCLSWNFDFDLVRFTDGGPETVFQPPFNVDYCLNALDSANQNIPIVVSDQYPRGAHGFPAVEELTVADPDKGEDNLRALMQPVDAIGTPFSDVELQDVTDLGYQAYFYLNDPDKEVLDPHALFTGLAIATQAGENRICVQLANADVTVIDTGVEAPSFWPGAVTGFSILSFLARGLAPALRFECDGSTGLPVKVDEMVAPGTINVTPVLAYEDATGLHEVTSGMIDRIEPFETPLTSRDYFLAIKANVSRTVNQDHTLTLKVTDLSMTPTQPLKGIPDINFIENREDANTIANFFSGTLVTGNREASVTIDANNKPGPNDLIKIPNFIIRPNNVEAVNPSGTISAFVPPGRAVAGTDVKLSVKMELHSNGPAQTRLTKSQFQLTLTNDETFEEYLRVFHQASEILASTSGSDTKFKDFDKSLYNALKAPGATVSTTLTEQGSDLWEHATQKIHTLKDDRPLYWARLRAIGALRAFCRRQSAPITGSALEQNIKQFEFPSRGLDPATGSINFSLGPPDPPGARKAVLTGFDPFSLPGQPDISNSSGVVALHFDRTLLHPTVGNNDEPVVIHTAVFPVRYTDFNNNIVENALKNNLDSIVMLMTCSRGTNGFYDVDRFAARMRGPNIDNNRVVTTAQSLPPNLTTPDPGDQYIASSLPYESVITAVDATRLLPRPGTDLTKQDAFVRNQSFEIVSADRSKPDEYQPRPTDRSDPNGYEPRPQPKAGKVLLTGSGGNYLSNEIFYRTALLRKLKRPQLASGHLHLPFTGPRSNDPQNTAPGLVEAVKIAATRFLANLFRLKPGGDVSFPATVVNHPSPSRFVTAVNQTTSTIAIGRVDLNPVVTPPTFVLQTALPITIAAGASGSIEFKFTPPSVGAHTATVTARTSGGEVLFTVNLTGEGIPVPAAPDIQSFQPTAGFAGDSVTIFGANLALTTDVKFGSTSAPFSGATDTEVTAEVSGTTRQVHITVVTPGGTAVSAGLFTVRRRRPSDDFAQELAARRDELQLTPTQAARELGVSAGSYRRWEQGKDRPSARFHPAIVTFLGHDPDPDPREVGQQIRAARERDGLSRAQLARQLGVSSGTIKSWEEGSVKRPTEHVAEIFENYLNQE